MVGWGRGSIELQVKGERGTAPSEKPVCLKSYMTDHVDLGQGYRGHSYEGPIAQKVEKPEVKSSFATH